LNNPDEHLDRLRELVTRAERSGWAGDPLLLDELAQRFKELDQMLSAGSDMPAAWSDPMRAKLLRAVYQRG